MSKAVAEKFAGAIGALGEAAEAFDEKMTRDDMSLPFVQMLQALSPVCQKGGEDYVAGAEASCLFNTVTQEVYPTLDDKGNPIPGLRVIDLVYIPSHIEWIPRTQGGGFVNEWSPEEAAQIRTVRGDQGDIIAEGSPLGTPGNQLQYTHTHYMFYLGENNVLEPAVMSMSATQVRASKDWNARINRLRLPNGGRAPRFFGIWDVSSRRRSNDQGTWFVPTFARSDIKLVKGDGIPSGTLLALPDAEELISECKDFVTSVRDGQIKASQASRESTQTTDASEGSPNVDANDANIPF